MTDYKALCARLCGAIAATDNKPRALDDVYAEAVDSLAEPVGEGLTDAPVDDLFNRFADSCDEYGLWSMGKDGLRAATLLQQQAAPAPDQVIVHCPETCWIEIRRIADGKVIYNNHRKGTLALPIDEPPAEPPAPAGGLVERLASVRNAGQPLNPAVARAAIREVAAWLDERGMHGCSLWLREEADRCP